MIDTMKINFFSPFTAYYKWLKHTRDNSQDMDEKVKDGFDYLETIWREGKAVRRGLQMVYDSYKVSTFIICTNE